MDAIKIVMDPFCFKNFEPHPDTGQTAIEHDREDFTQRVNTFYLENKDTAL